MQSTEFDVTRKETKFFTTLSFLVPSNNIVNCLDSTLREVLKQNSISEENITDIHFQKVEQYSKELVSVTIKYCNLNLSELKAMDKPDRIKAVLKHMGYDDKDIKSIVSIKFDKLTVAYQEYPDELYWKVKVHNTMCSDYAPDESYSVRDYVNGVNSRIREVLGFYVIIDFV